MSLPSSEEWRDVPGYEGLYEVSNLGRVYSIRRPNASMSGRLMTPNPHPRTGHLHVSLYGVSGRRYTAKVHRLVAEAFLPRSDRDYLVRHLDGNTENNQVGNLAWGTQSENGLDSVRHGTHNNASKTHCKHGHPFSPENTGLVETGRDAGCRYCITCRRNRSRRQTAA